MKCTFDVKTGSEDEFLVENIIPVNDADVLERNSSNETVLNNELINLTKVQNTTLCTTTTSVTKNCITANSTLADSTMHTIISHCETHLSYGDSLASGGSSIEDSHALTFNHALSSTYASWKPFYDEKVRGLFKVIVSSESSNTIVLMENGCIFMNKKYMNSV